MDIWADLSFKVVRVNATTVYPPRAVKGGYQQVKGAGDGKIVSDVNYKGGSSFMAPGAGKINIRPVLEMQQQQQQSASSNSNVKSSSSSLNDVAGYPVRMAKPQGLKRGSQPHKVKVKRKVKKIKRRKKKNGASAAAVTLKKIRKLLSRDNVAPSSSGVIPKPAGAAGTKEKAPGWNKTW